MGVPYFDVAMKTSIKVFNQNVLSEVRIFWLPRLDLREIFFAVLIQQLVLANLFQTNIFLNILNFSFGFSYDKQDIIKGRIDFFNHIILYYIFGFQRDRSQCLIFDGHKGMFPCKYLDKSYNKPKSVHKLRPGDIDIGVFHQL